TLKTLLVTHEDINEFYNPAPGSYALIIVTDTGIGMDKETQQRIFDPFFTTKGIRQGSGLGLASVYGILKSHKGYVEVESEPGLGSAFYIYLPASDIKVIDQVKGGEPASNMLKASGTVLVVDDENSVLEVGVEMLKEIGYTVLFSDNSRRGLEIYRQKQKDIDLVILDMIMPGMSGGEVYDKIKEINPRVKVILSSGYSMEGQATEIMQRGCNGFIQKPFGLKELSQKIREVCL
ncbi:MAG: response regulator, partial [Pseudomonadota bacterium]